LESVYTATYRGFESLPLCKACHESDRLFSFETAPKACFRKLARAKKDRSKRSLFLKGFGKRARFGMLERSDSNPSFGDYVQHSEVAIQRLFKALVKELDSC